MQGVRGSIPAQGTKIPHATQRSQKNKKNKTEKKVLKNSQPSHIAKNEKALSEENTQGVAEQPFDKEITGTNHRSNRPS